jgi:hypothetical protein
MPDIMNSVSTLLGYSQDGGGKSRRKSKSRKVSSKNKVRKVRKVRKMPMKRRPMRFGYFGGAERFICTKDETTNPAPAPAPAPAPGTGTGTGTGTGITAPLMGGGKSARYMSAYKKFLKGMTLEKLQRLAVSKGIKIKKKRNGKTSYVKKSTLVSKLCKCKLRKLRKLRKQRRS